MKKPLIHLITNYVTVNDVVNIILACGGTAICADAPEEVEEITAIADALVINIGTPSKVRFEAMLKAGHKANEKGIPVVLDPVGAGSSKFRDDFLKKLLSEVKVDCIRGNYSEIYALNGNALSDAEGVEDSGDVSLEDAQNAADSLTERYHTIVAMTGKKDYVTNGEEVSEWPEGSGSEMQKLITGSGCMLSGLLGLAMAGEDDKYGAVCGCIDIYNEAASEAEVWVKSLKIYGTATYRQFLIDAAGRAFNPQCLPRETDTEGAF